MGFHRNIVMVMASLVVTSNSSSSSSYHGCLALEGKYLRIAKDFTKYSETISILTQLKPQLFWPEKEIFHEKISFCTPSSL